MVADFRESVCAFRGDATEMYMFTLANAGNRLHSLNPGIVAVHVHARPTIGGTEGAVSGARERRVRESDRWDGVQACLNN